MTATGRGCVKTRFISYDEVSQQIIVDSWIWLRQFSSVGRFSMHRFVALIFVRDVGTGAARE